jgi:hypothetical protein
MPLQTLPADPQPTISAACVLEGAAKTISFEQLPEAIRIDLKRRAPDLWVPGPTFDASGVGAPRRFLAAARLDLRYVVAYEHDGWSYHVNLLSYDMASSDVTPKAERSYDRRPTCEVLAGALKTSQQPGRP